MNISRLAPSKNDSDCAKVLLAIRPVNPKELSRTDSINIPEEERRGLELGIGLGLGV